MAYRSDTNNRDINNTWNETILDGEIPGYDRGLSFPYKDDIDKLYEAFTDFEVEISSQKYNLIDKAKILYRSEDQEEIYELVDRVTSWEITEAFLWIVNGFITWNYIFHLYFNKFKASLIQVTVYFIWKLWC